MATHNKGEVVEKLTQREVVERPAEATPGARGSESNNWRDWRWASIIFQVRRNEAIPHSRPAAWVTLRFG
jgi:hypothetical protein